MTRINIRMFDLLGKECRKLFLELRQSIPPERFALGSVLADQLIDTYGSAEQEIAAVAREYEKITTALEDKSNSLTLRNQEIQILRNQIKELEAANLQLTGENAALKTQIPTPPEKESTEPAQ